MIYSLKGPTSKRKPSSLNRRLEPSVFTNATSSIHGQTPPSHAHLASAPNCSYKPPRSTRTY